MHPLQHQQWRRGADGGTSHPQDARGPAHPASRGCAYENAQRLDYYQNGCDSLTAPPRRRPDGTFEAIDWDTAIREVRARLGAVRDAHGGETIFYNPHRRHSALDYRSPVNYERSQLTLQ